MNKILAIETSCDETAAAVTEGTRILSSVKWTQLEHGDWGGVVPSLARRVHEERIDGIAEQALSEAGCQIVDIGAIAVTVGPGLAIALEVGIRKAKELANKYKKPLIAVNHIEGHILSPLAMGAKPKFPALALVVSGGHTELDLVSEIGKYKIIAEKIDDALGEALDKAARMLGIPYPGGAGLEKMAREGNSKAYPLPLPMAGREDQNQFSYSGLKTAMKRLVDQLSVNGSQLSEQMVNDLAAGFQHRAFEHLIRVTRKSIQNLGVDVHDLLVGGGVAANQELRSKILELGKELGIQVHFSPNELFGDNAAMIGIVAGFKAEKGQFVRDAIELDRKPRWRVDA